MNEDTHEPEGENTSCPLCGRAAVDRFAPFCSRRCAQIDLGRWISGTCVIAGESDGSPADNDDDNMG